MLWASHKSTNKNKFPPKRAKHLATSSSSFIFLSSSLIRRRALCSQLIGGNVRRTGRILPEHVERSFLDPEHSFVAVRRIPRTRFPKQKFAQLRSNCVRPTGRIFPEHVERSLLDPEHVVRRIPRTRFAKHMFAQLKKGYRPLQVNAPNTSQTHLQKKTTRRNSQKRTTAGQTISDVKIMFF